MHVKARHTAVFGFGDEALSGVALSVCVQWHALAGQQPEEKSNNSFIKFFQCKNHNAMRDYLLPSSSLLQTLSFHLFCHWLFLSLVLVFVIMFITAHSSALGNTEDGSNFRMHLV